MIPKEKIFEEVMAAVGVFLLPLMLLFIESAVTP